MRDGSEASSSAMHQTPWTKKAPSSFPSDRLRPKPAPTPSRPKNTQTPPEPAPPQSKALRTLTALRSSLQDPSSSTTPDPTGGCFCQARTHPLSPYVPICTACGLPLCNLAAPAHPCPSCSESLLTPARRTALITRIDTEIADILLKEQQARERAEQERRAAVGAFPTLSSAPSHSQTQSQSQSPSPNPNPTQQPKTHKVLSLNSKTKRAVLTTTTTTPRTSASSTPAASRPASPQPTREPRPGVDSGKGKAKADAVHVSPRRPYENLAGGGAVYVPPSRVGDDDEADGEGKSGGGAGAGGGRRKRGRGGKGKGKEGGGGGGEGKESAGPSQSGGG
ncbi:hypothetical protein D9615_003833 [Tricholomella constricta]|uniref:TRIP4/RQT4 C2HC5-type zinc finger domain-containing protein n=1 Tax=Tricholomella constricta TaxID=117010 RepID=A0A8H5HHW5_9AGAR|nr:hypothetical protein D9615_003833 [Tricholomella constricta]